MGSGFDRVSPVRRYRIRLSARYRPRGRILSGRRRIPGSGNRPLLHSTSSGPLERRAFQSTRNDPAGASQRRPLAGYRIRRSGLLADRRRRLRTYPGTKQTVLRRRQSRSLGRQRFSGRLPLDRGTGSVPEIPQRVDQRIPGSCPPPVTGLSRTLQLQRTTGEPVGMLFDRRTGQRGLPNPGRHDDRAVRLFNLGERGSRFFTGLGGRMDRTKSRRRSPGNRRYPLYRAGGSSFRGTLP